MALGARAGTEPVEPDGEAAARDRLRALALRALDLAEEERARVARQLYDDTAQRLAALLLRLRLARDASDHGRRQRMLDEVRAELTETLDAVRGFAHDLRPTALDELGLLAAVQSHIRELARVEGLEVRLVSRSEVKGWLTPEAEVGLYRIVQESLSNVARHSGSKRATVEIRRDGDRVFAVVADAGRGFDPVATLAGGLALGLMGMQERAAQLGGELEIRSSPDAGTRITAVVPARGVVADVPVSVAGA